MRPTYIRKAIRFTQSSDLNVNLTCEAIQSNLTPVRMAMINKSTNKCRRGCEEREEHFCTLDRNADLCIHCGKQYGDTSKKLKMELPFDPVILLLEIYPKEPKTLIQKNISTSMFIAESFTTTKIWKQPNYPSIDEWIKQLWDIYKMESCSAIKKKKILPFETVWMDLENVMLSEISQSEKDKYHMISRICGI